MQRLAASSVLCKQLRHQAHFVMVSVMGLFSGRISAVKLTGCLHEVSAQQALLSEERVPASLEVSRPLSAGMHLQPVFMYTLCSFTVSTFCSLCHCLLEVQHFRTSATSNVDHQCLPGNNYLQMCYVCISTVMACLSLRLMQIHRALLVSS